MDSSEESYMEFDLYYDRDYNRYNVMSTALTYVLDDWNEDYYVVFGRKRARTHALWMSPWLEDRTDPTQRNTLAKLEADFIALGCPGEFKNATRMPCSVYMVLLEKVRPYITYRRTRFRKPITAEERLSLTIRYLTRGDSTATLAHGYLVAQSSVLRIVKDTCKAIYRVLHEEYIKTPKTTEEWMVVAQDFHDRWNLPHVMGALDGKHIRMTRPRNTGSVYFNYKGYYSIILFAMVDAQYRFMYVDVGGEGRSSDSSIWNFSDINKDVLREDNPLQIPDPSPHPGYRGLLPYYFVGDDAFEMSLNLMKPYPARALTLTQRIYNYRISRCRRIVENAFGILATRFRILRREIEMAPEHVTAVVLTCVAIHNYLRTTAPSAYLPKEATDWEGRDYQQHQGVWRGEPELSGGAPSSKRNHPTPVKDMRDALADWCLTREGELDYQYDVILRHEFFFQR